MKKQAILRRKRALSAVVAATLAFGLAGCSGNEKSEATPVPFGSGAPTTPASSSSPTTTAPTTSAPPTSALKAQRPKLEKPEYPEAARENSDAGIKATLDYFFAAYRYGIGTGDAVPLSYVSDPECEFCGEQIERMSDLRDSDGWVDSGSVSASIRSIRPNEKHPEIKVANITVNQPEAVEYDSSGMKTGSSKASIQAITALLVLDDGRWIIGELGKW